jgi:hypothetical protein
MADNTRDIVIGLRTEVDFMKSQLAETSQTVREIRDMVQQGKGAKKGITLGVVLAGLGGGTVGAFMDKILATLR